MSTILILATLLLVWALAFKGVALWLWTGVGAVMLIVLQHLGAISGLWAAPLWLIYLGVAIVLNYRPLRQQLFSKAFFNWFSKQVPPMSDTEKAAIEAGDVWWDAELFCGYPKWQRLLETPEPKLSAAEQAFMDNQVETLCTKLDDWKFNTEDRDLTPEVWEYLKKEKFFGMIIPKRYGGLEFSAYAHSSVVARIASRSIIGAVTTMVPNSLGPAELLLHYGTEEQKNYYLPRLAEGKEIPCFALTSQDAGSDAGAIKDAGVVCMGEYNGEKVLGMRLTWSKRYITLAPAATVLGLAFKLYDPDGLLGDKKDLGITVCLLPTSHPGVEIGRRHCPMNVNFLNGPTKGTDVFVPLDWIVGGKNMVGQGWRMLVECLSAGRGISLPALSTAITQACYRSSGAYARIRRQFNIPIGHFEGIQEVMAQVGGYNYILESSRRLTTSAVDLGLQPSVISAIAKCHMTELARRALINAMDIHAGKAIMMGPRNILAQAFQAIPISITVEGANILTRNLMIFGQGSFRCHPFLQKEMLASVDEDKKRGLDDFDKNMFAHAGYIISNIARSFGLGLTRGRVAPSPKTGWVSEYYRKLHWMSAGLALSSDAAFLLLGGALKRKEQLSARFGDILSYLYLASAVLKYYSDNGEPVEEKAHAKWALEFCLAQIQKAFVGLFNNFPNKWLALALKTLIFPTGLCFKAPSDKLSRQLAHQMLTPSELRDRLTHLCYIGEDAYDPLGCLENAMEKLIIAEPALNKFRHAIKEKTLHEHIDFGALIQDALKQGIISEEEVTQLKEFDHAQQIAIAVDDFDAAFFKGNDQECQTQKAQIA